MICPPTKPQTRNYEDIEIGEYTKIKVHVSSHIMLYEDNKRTQDNLD